MKTAAFIPIKENSKRVKGKNFRDFCGKPLYQHFLDKLIDSPFDDIYVNTDSKEVRDYTNNMGWKVIDRPADLSKDSANGNDLLLYDASQVDVDLYFQLFITAPLLTQKTIQDAFNIMQKEEKYDSLFTAVEIYSWFWFKKKPVNYNPKILPRSQDAVPIIRETTGLYAIRKEALLSEKCRIGKNPYMLMINEVEASDLDIEMDFVIAEFLQKQQQD